MDSRKHLAAEKKRCNSHNCAQSVVCTYCDLVGAGMIVGLATKDRNLSRARMKDIAGITPAPEDDEFELIRDNLQETDAVKVMNYTMSLQKYLDIRYDRLYLADIHDLFVCNLEDGLKESSRIAGYPISQDNRKAFYSETIRRQNGISELG